MCNNCSDNCVVNVSPETKDAVRRYYTCPSWEVQARQYLQFGELVFDGKRTIESQGASFKSNLTTFLGQNGGFDTSCVPLLETATISLTIEFAFTKMSNIQKQDYSNYIKRNLTGTNRLWAVDTGGQLIWAWAKVTSVSENQDAPRSVKSMSVEFTLPSGEWYIADLSKVYVEEFDRCDTLDLGCGCPAMCLDDPFADCNVEDCCADMCRNCTELICDLTDDKLFCNTDLNLYWNCQACFRLIYNCKSTDPCNVFRNFGMAVLQNHKKAIAGTFCSNTVLGGDIALHLVGTYHNPEVWINGESISIKGDYTGIIRIDTSGDIVYFPNAEKGKFCGNIVIDLDNICYNCNITKFTTKPCENTIQVFGAKDDGEQIVYIDLVDKTY